MATQIIEKDILKTGRDLCNPSFVKSITKFRITPVLLGTFMLWSQLVLAWYIALKLPLIFSIISFIVIIACHQAMALWVHEGSHKLFQDQKFNDLWVDFFYATPLGTTISKYRTNHLSHHAYLGSFKDLDNWEYAFNIKGGNLFKIILKSLTGIYGFKTLSKYINKDSIQTVQYSRILMSAFWNVSLLWLCIINEKWYLYFLLWLIPLFTITKCLIILRATAEHQPHGYTHTKNDYPEIGEAVRTTIPPFWQKWLFYQVNFNYHVEHHMFPAVPFYNLPQLHKHLKEKMFYDKFPECLQFSTTKKLNELRLLHAK